MISVLQIIGRVRPEHGPLQSAPSSDRDPPALAKCTVLYVSAGFAQLGIITGWRVLRAQEEKRHAVHVGHSSARDSLVIYDCAFGVSQNEPPFSQVLTGEYLLFGQCPNRSYALTSVYRSHCSSASGMTPSAAQLPSPNQLVIAIKTLTTWWHRVANETSNVAFIGDNLGKWGEGRMGHGRWQAALLSRRYLFGS
jgi:hypothetical protein